MSARVRAGRGLGGLGLYKSGAARGPQSAASHAMTRVTLLALLCVGATAAAAQSAGGADPRPTVTADPVTETPNTEPVTRSAGPSDATAEPAATTVLAATAATTVLELTTPPERAPTARSFIKPNPRFISKLGYFNRANSAGSGGAATNLVDRPDGGGNKRRFKSRCRCEKIWNCPKLQITVPRCPDEYFLCCF